MHFETLPLFEEKIRNDVSFEKFWNQAKLDLNEKSIEWILNKWKPYQDTIYCKLKDKHLNLRIVGHFEWIQADSGLEPVLYVLDIFQRASHKYDKLFLPNKEAYGNSQWGGQLRNLRQQVHKRGIPIRRVEPTPELPLRMADWISTLPAWENMSPPSRVLLETYRWREHLREIPYKYHGFVYEALQTIAEPPKNFEYLRFRDWADLFHHNHQNICIVYTLFPLLLGGTGVLLVAVADDSRLEHLEIGLLPDERVDPPSLYQATLHSCGHGDVAQRLEAFMFNPPYFVEDLRGLASDRVT